MAGYFSNQWFSLAGLVWLVCYVADRVFLVGFGRIHCLYRHSDVLVMLCGEPLKGKCILKKERVLCRRGSVDS